MAVGPEGFSTPEGLSSGAGRLLRSTALLRKKGPGVTGAVSLALLAAVIGFDWVTGSDISPTLLYVIVAGGSAWSISVRWGLLVAALSVIAGMVLIGDEVSSAVLVINAGTRLALTVGVVVLLAFLRSVVEQLEAFASTDPLTGLMNRRALFTAADHEQARALRAGDPMTFAYFDLDGLKRTNDQLGHDSGDALIIEFATALRRGLRRSDWIARLGGDEFVALLPATDNDGAAQVVRRLLQHAPAASCGIATFKPADRSIGEMVAAADALMYVAKSQRTGVEAAVNPAAPAARLS